MESSEIFDFNRMFIGEHSLWFLLEIVFRTAIMYFYTIFLFRMLGKRGMGQISSLELAIIICFGSAAGDPMVYHDVPITYGMLAITVVALLQIGTEKIINKSPKIEKVAEGVPECLVDNGIIQLDVLDREELSHADLFRALRIKEVTQLGEVKKAFFETSGDITVVFHSHKRTRPGLSIIPDGDYKPHEKKGTNLPLEENKSYCCANCGNCQEVTGSHAPSCDVCGEKKWVPINLNIEE